MKMIGDLRPNTFTFTGGMAVMAPETSFVVFGNLVPKRIIVKCLLYY
jgi:hypothetical protein